MTLEFGGGKLLNELNYLKGRRLPVPQLKIIGERNSRGDSTKKKKIKFDPPFGIFYILKILPHLVHTIDSIHFDGKLS